MLYATLSLSQDTLFRTAIYSSKNDTLVNTTLTQYNDFYQPIVEIHIQHSTNDTIEYIYDYNIQQKRSQIITNRLGKNERSDTIFYEYKDTLVKSIQRENGKLRIRVEDHLQRPIYSSSKSFDINGNLYYHRVDSVFYSDSGRLRTNKSYQKYIQRTNHKDDILIEPIGGKVNGQFYLFSTSILRKDKAGNVIELKSSSGDEIYTHALYTHDDQNRLTYYEVHNYHGASKHNYTKFEYENIGDTLIRKRYHLTNRDDKTPSLYSVIKESQRKINGEPLWQFGYVNNELIGEVRRYFNKDDQIIRLQMKSKKNGEWSENEQLYIYESYE
ncbi:hypothetical protein DXU93_13265 [Brumimicrobium aurantiacum]|uniref:Uncharacterized protein n=2 Tax=Brumimicrobium aurantiacum TaxID=1737063 RepID=A0A3E1EV16_9FLAO|nr:hypothetical protein DXU93_13265 [Brumimicrobium aurantiacum]